MLYSILQLCALDQISIGVKRIVLDACLVLIEDLKLRKIEEKYQLSIICL